MYRQNVLVSSLFKLFCKKQLSGRLQTASLANLFPIVNESDPSIQHIQCICCRTPSHRKTLNQATYFCQHSSLTSPAPDKEYRYDNDKGHRKQINKALLLMLVGTGLFSYSVWKAKQRNLNSPFVVFALEPDKPGDRKISKAKNSKRSRLESNAPTLSRIDEKIPEYVPYLLIGAGTASHSAMRAIRLRDHTAQVLIVGDEDNNPYSRPPLSKELWFGEKTGVFYDPSDFYLDPEDLPSTKYGGVAVLKGRKVVKLNTEKRIAYLDNGNEIKYDKCLIATGGRPKNLPVFDEADEDVKSRVHVLRNIDDFTKLYKMAHTSKSIAIIGGGFLGSELACAFSYTGQHRGTKVYQILPEKYIMSKVLPEYLGRHATDKIREGGVEILAERSVKSAVFKDDEVVITLSDGSEVKVHDVVVTVGCQPNDELAKTTGLEIDPVRGGFLANAELEVRPNIWVAGDVASFYDYKYGRCRVEHHSHADTMGKLAGENMTGAGKLYEHEPYFWSDLGTESYQAIGEVDSSLETFSIFYKIILKGKEMDETDNSSQDKVGSSVLGPTNDYEGVVFYYKDNQIVGIVLWNVFGRGKVHIARQILKRSKEIRNEDPYELSKLLFHRYKKESEDDNKDIIKPSEQNKEDIS